MGDTTSVTGIGPWWRNARAAQRRYREFYGHRPRLLLLRRHSERIHREKVFRRDRRLPVLADKIEVKSYIASRVGEEHVVVGLARGRDGRKTYTASTLYDSDGRVVACAEHVWVAVDPAAFRPES